MAHTGDWWSRLDEADELLLIWAHHWLRGLAKNEVRVGNHVDANAVREKFKSVDQRAVEVEEHEVRSPAKAPSRLTREPFPEKVPDAHLGSQLAHTIAKNIRVQ